MAHIKAPHCGQALIFPLKRKSSPPRTVKLRINEKRALLLFQALQRAWVENDEIFRGVVLPQDMFPMPEGDREKALWFFYTALTQRGGVISEDPFKLLFHLRKKYPNLFVPEEVMKYWPWKRIAKELRIALGEVFPKEKKIPLLRVVPSQTDLYPGLKVCAGMEKRESEKELEPSFAEVLRGGRRTSRKSPKGYKIDELARSWEKNSKALAECWGGDPRFVFNGCRDFNDVFQRIDIEKNPHRGFMGMRRKIFSLLTIWLQEKGLVPIIPTPIPFDFHAQRLLLVTKVLILDDVAKPFHPDPSKPNHPKELRGQMMFRAEEKWIMDPLSMWSQDFIRRNKLNHMIINPALWILSREFCSEQYQNGTRKKGMEFFLPEKMKDSSAWPRWYKDPCGHCPVEHLCSLVSPASVYYTLGRLVYFERVQYPFPRLPGYWLQFSGFISRKSKRLRKPKGEINGLVEFRHP